MNHKSVVKKAEIVMIKYLKQRALKNNIIDCVNDFVNSFIISLF